MALGEFVSRCATACEGRREEWLGPTVAFGCVSGGGAAGASPFRSFCCFGCSSGWLEWRWGGEGASAAWVEAWSVARGGGSLRISAIVGADFSWDDVALAFKVDEVGFASEVDGRETGPAAAD